MKKNLSTQKQLELIEQKIHRKEYKDALDLLEALYVHNAADLHINLLIGEMHLSIGQFRESEKYFQNAMKIEENHFQALYGLGKVYYMEGRLKDGIKNLRQAHQLKPDKYDICRDLGIMYKDADDFKNAQKFLTLACQLNWYNDESQLLLLELYSRYNKIQEALEIIQQYYKNPKNPDLIFRKAMIDIQDQNYEQAIKEFSKIIDMQPQNVDALYHRGFCYMNVNDVKEARSDFERCLELTPEADDIHAVLALTYALEGKISHSIDIWKEFFPILTKKSTAKSAVTGIGTIQPMQIIDSLEKEEEKYELSIVIPVYNEEGSLLILFDKLKNVLEDLGKSYQIVFIDDGSTDNSLSILEDLCQRNNHVSTLKFRRNYGQTAAFAAGFKYATGDIIITMDADLQNDPVDIPDLLQKMSEGYDIVSGWRKDRQDHELSRKIPSKIANRIINKLISGTGIKIHDFGCSLKAYKKGIVKRIKLYGEMHRFIPAYAAWLGIRVTEIPVTHHSRKFGVAKYGLERVWRVILDLITLRFYTGFRTHPLLFFGKFALMTMMVGFGISLFLLVLRMISNFGITGQTFMIFLVFTLLGGLQFIIVGLLSEIITRGFFEAKDSDEYLVEQIIK